MNCTYHPEVEKTAFCIKCGKPLCEQCVRQVQSSIYCVNCVVESNPTTNAAPSPVLTSQGAGGASPEAGFLLGLIPGVGAIYNAEYFKAALHLIIFATLVTLSDGTGRAGETIFGFLAFGFYAYMPFEAYYTAKKRKLAREGINLITPFDQLNEQLGMSGNLELWGGVLLVAVGVLFLLDNFNVVPLEQVKRFWPILLVLAGLLLLRRFQLGKKI
jgi:hypothetical protein